jgi:hypothetical protein
MDHSDSVVISVTINPVLTAEKYPLPLIGEPLSGLAGGQIQ